MGGPHAKAFTELMMEFSWSTAFLLPGSAFLVQEWIGYIGAT